MTILMSILTIIFTIKEPKLYFLLVTLSAIYNQKLSKLLSKVLERSVYQNKLKTKSQNKNPIDKYRYLLESKFVGINRSLFCLMQTKMIMQKGIKAEGIIYQKLVIRTIMSSSMEKTFMTSQWILT